MPSKRFLQPAQQKPIWVPFHSLLGEFCAIGRPDTGQASFIIPRLACLAVHGQGVPQVHGSHLHVFVDWADWQPPKSESAAMKRPVQRIRFMDMAPVVDVCVNILLDLIQKCPRRDIGRFFAARMRLSIPSGSAWCALDDRF